MKIRNSISKCFAVAALAAVGGCYSYDPVPAPVEGENYTGLDSKEHQKMPSDIDLLTLEEASQISLKNNPDLISKAHAIAAAWARYYYALGAYSPTVSGSYGLTDTYTRPGYSSQEPGSNRADDLNQQMGLTANWTIFDGLQREMNILVQRHKAKASEYTEDDSRRLLLKSVATQYNSIMLAIEQNRIALADMEFQQRLLNDTQLKYDAGAVPLSDVLNFKIKVNTAEGNQISAQYSYNTAKYSLSALMGLTQGTLPDTVKFPPMSSEIGEQLIDIGVYIDTALANRPDLKQYRELLLAAEYTLYYKWGAFSPTLSSSAGYNYTIDKTDYDMRYGSRYQGADSYTSSTRSRATNWGVSANWLIFDGIQRYEQVREAQALLAQNQYEMANKWINVVQEVRAAYDNYVQNTKQAILFKKTLSLVTKQRELVEEEYKAGNVELTRLNEAQNAVVKADTDLVSALINVQNAKAQLDAATNAK